MSLTQKLLQAIGGEPCRRPPELGPTFGKPDRVAPLVVIVALSKEVCLRLSQEQRNGISC